jgi:hypothetical protein
MTGQWVIERPLGWSSDARWPEAEKHIEEEWAELVHDGSH